MSWIILLFAGILEVGWAVGLKFTEGFTRPMPTFLTVSSMAVSMFLLGVAVKNLPIGTAYAVWTGIGTVGTAILGIFLFREPASFLRVLCISMIVMGILGLKFVASE